MAMGRLGHGAWGMGLDMPFPHAHDTDMPLQAAVGGSDAAGLLAELGPLTDPGAAVTIEVPSSAT